MRPSRSTMLITRLIAYVVITYGLIIILDALTRQLRVHHGRKLDLLLITVPQIAGLGFLYLGTLLLRRKYNAWLAALVLFGVTTIINISHMILPAHAYPDGAGNMMRLALPILMMFMLWLTRDTFKVKSDMRTFQQAVWVCVLVLGVAFMYGIAGFLLLDDHDFHYEIGFLSAVHLTIDQFGLTTNHPVAYSHRARLFLDSLPIISIAAVVYAAISLFEPIRVHLMGQAPQRSHAALLLEEYPSDIDDYFKLWPHDKLYHFDETGDAGISYHVTRGVALIVGNPFGSPKHFKGAISSFLELCFVNDWMPTFIHVTSQYRKLYESFGFKFQKIGEEAILDLEAFETTKNDKYFRQIRNRFTKLNYSVEVVRPPHTAATIERLQAISDEWLKRPGRAERGFMLGYFNSGYLQESSIALLYDENQEVQGFINVVPTFEKTTANYDLLRCCDAAPGNANDFLMMGLIEHLRSEGVQTFNLGLCPLSGVDAPDNEETTLIDQALRFLYANGDRFYSFSGLRRFKSKYQPNWQPRYIAYMGGIRGFSRSLRALNRAMKIR